MDDDDSYMGAITLRRALTLSRNIVAVKLAERVGLDRIIDYAHRMGVTSPLEANLSLALGSSGVTVLDQASGYSTLANQGLHTDPTPFRIVKDSLGSTVLDDRFPQATDVVSAGTAYIMTSMFEDVINRGTGYPNAVIGRPAAGKTGTTSSFRDAWFVGYTPDLVAAVWLGNDDYTPMESPMGQRSRANMGALHESGVGRYARRTNFHFLPKKSRRSPVVASGGYEYYLKGTEPEADAVTRSARTIPVKPRARPIPRLGELRRALVAAADATPPAVLPPPPTIPPTPSPLPSESAAPRAHRRARR